MILPLLAALQVAATATPVLIHDSIPTLTLAEALERGAGLDPNYVAALGHVGEAEWGRRNAVLAFVAPALDVFNDWTYYSTEFFNVGTGENQRNLVTGQLNLRYEIFALSKFTELGRSRAALDASEASEVKQRYLAALVVEQVFYQVLADKALASVAAERVHRADEQLAVARARVQSGAVVHSDSLQLLLELTRAQVDLLRSQAQLRVSQLELGRRTGASDAVDAAPLGEPVPDSLPITLDQAVTEALETGPDWRLARAQASAAEHYLKGLKGEYLPKLDLSFTAYRFDDHFFPSARSVSAIDLVVRWNIWDLGRRELAIAQAKTTRDVTRAVSLDLARAARHDVALAYESFTTARAALDLTTQGLVVAQENFRVQEERYRAGAATILLLLDAQVGLTQAQADQVQAVFVARLAWAGLEAILGRRLSSPA
ncbi:MAG TPA: TolC family protein [Gemmatimonadales bacterium]|nr:TolC family protein [Gemmatimonadales bacterium]